MKKGRTLFLCSLLILFKAVPTSAGEGFSTRRQELPEALRSAWDATFHLVGEFKGDKVMASAFLVKKDSVSSKEKALYFLTNHHVIESICGERLGPCPGLHLTHLGYDTDSGDYLANGIAGATFHQVEVERVSANPDLALLRVNVPAEVARAFKPLPLLEDCAELYVAQAVYLIGYPMMIDRRYSRVKPVDKHLKIKRWSRGLLVDNVHFREGGQLEYLLATTADILPGNSGGPALDECGRLLGVTQGLHRTKDDRYSGVEKEPLRYHSYLVRCEYLEDFIQGLPLSFDPLSEP
jgi:S1-C subfamily serine protease